MESMEIVALISIYVYISLWGFMMYIYTQMPATPYRQVYNIFSVLQWLVIGVALVHLYGWAYGLLGLLFTAFFLAYLTNATLGLLYRKVFTDPLTPLVLFGLMFWLNTGITAALFIV